MNLNNIRIVLIETSHPGNIGAAARAMKTMGLSDLCLVKPKCFPDSKAVAMASGATGILDEALVVDSVQQAIADCTLVMGSSARSQRYIRWPIMSARECGEYVQQKTQEGVGRIAILFGRERTGLTNEELEHCHALINIPVNPEYSSLNVAAAVQVLGYELSMAAGLFTAGESDTGEIKQQAANESTTDKRVDALASAEDMEGFYEHLQRMLMQVKYLNPDNPRLLMRRLRRLYGRTQLTRSELNILRGITSACEGRKFLSRAERDESGTTK